MSLQLQSFVWQEFNWDCYNYTHVIFIVLVLLGNKADLEDQRVVDEGEAKTLAENLGLKYFETSAYTGQNVTKSVEALLDQVRNLTINNLSLTYDIV